MTFHGRRVPVKLDLSRRRDGGLVGHWQRTPLILRVSTFDSTRLQQSDYVDIPRAANLFLEVFGHQANTPRAYPWAKISFRSADSPYTRRDTRFRGFFYYDIPIPTRPLSGGLRFRCTPASVPTSFAHGADLLCPTGLPWALPLPNLVGVGAKAIMQSLLRDNLVSLRDVVASRKTFHDRAHPAQPVVHAVGQPWYLDFSAPTMILVPGPTKLLRCWVYPAIARYGSALVRFEHTNNPDHPHEVVLRILELRSAHIALHSTYAHLPPFVSGTLLPHPFRSNGSTWTWNYDIAQKDEMAAGLYCLIHGPAAHTDTRPSESLRLSLRHRMHWDLPAAGDDVFWEGEDTDRGRGS